MTNAQFARALARLATHAAAWSGDAIDCGPMSPVVKASAQRFIGEHRDRLNFIESVVRGLPAPSHIDAQGRGEGVG